MESLQRQLGAKAGAGVVVVENTQVISDGDGSFKLPPGCQRKGCLLNHTKKKLIMLGEPAPRQQGKLYTVHQNAATAARLQACETGCIQLAWLF